MRSADEAPITIQVQDAGGNDLDVTCAVSAEGVGFDEVRTVFLRGVMCMCVHVCMWVCVCYV